MALRRWISVLAMAGMLVHAGLLVRHNAVMAAAHLQHQSLVADLRVICHSNGTISADSGVLPAVPRPLDADNGCPLCSGLAPAVALNGPDAVPLGAPFPVVTSVGHAVAATRLAAHSPTLLPPARGPPSIV